MKEFIVRVIDPEEIQWYEEEPEIPELVRCKDCQHQDDLRYEVGGKFVCRKGHGWNPDSFFCADGEPRKKKDGEGDG